MSRKLEEQFADDFVGINNSKESLRKLIDVAHSYNNKLKH